VSLGIDAHDHQFGIFEKGMIDKFEHGPFRVNGKVAESGSFCARPHAIRGPCEQGSAYVEGCDMEMIAETGSCLLGILVAER